MGNHFVEINELTAQSIKVDHTIRQWMQTLSQEEKERFVDDLFYILYAYGDSDGDNDIIALADHGYRIDRMKDLKVLNEETTEQ